MKTFLIATLEETEGLNSSERYSPGRRAFSTSGRGRALDSCLEGAIMPDGSVHHRPQSSNLFFCAFFLFFSYATQKLIGNSSGVCNVGSRGRIRAQRERQERVTRMRPYIVRHLFGAGAAAVVVVVARRCGGWPVYEGVAQVAAAAVDRFYGGRGTDKIYVLLSV
jgi:hypothetical protein